MFYVLIIPSRHILDPILQIIIYATYIEQLKETSF